MPMVGDFTNILIANPADADAIADELVGYIPESWTSPEAKQQGGVLRLLLAAFAQCIAVMKANIIDAKKQLRINTAMGEFLDAIALDYFGSGDTRLLRSMGESDDSFRSRIKAEILAERGTVNGVANAVSAFTGGATGIFEPFNAQVVACWHAEFNGNTPGTQNFTPLTQGCWGSSTTNQFGAGQSNPNVGAGACGDLNVIYTFYVNVLSNPNGRLYGDVLTLVNRNKPAGTLGIIYGI